MKIISLNTWGGRMHDDLMEFLRTHSDTDMFCLQEVYHQAHGKDTIWHGANFDTFNDIKAALPEHRAYYHPHLGDWWGLALFALPSLELKEVGESYVHLFKGHNIDREVLGHTAKNVQYAKTLHNGTPLTVINFHGLWNGEGKTDCRERIEQSEKIAEFIKGLEGEIVLCGDFNLLPNTQSLRIIEETGLRNLIAEYGIASTRTSLYTKPEKFADYMFVSQGLQVKEFKVLPHEVSDHAPLYIELA
jgi:endonuclease/exonuclease/phosphatase family metal-dependent hydrolase